MVFTHYKTRYNGKYGGSRCSILDKLSSLHLQKLDLGSGLEGTNFEEYVVRFFERFML